MAYTDFTIEQLRIKFGIKDRVKEVFGKVEPCEPNDLLKNSIRLSKFLQLRNEKIKSEVIVAPILLYLIDKNSDFLTFFSGETLNYDKKLGLAGEIDFILSKKTDSYGLNFPLLAIVEAKRNDFELGIPQCIAQLIAANKYNEALGTHIPKLYGCVTTADEWLFIEFQGKDVTIDKKKYKIDNIDELLGVFQFIIDYYKTFLE